MSELCPIEECDLCPVEDIELFIYWFSAMKWGAIKLSNLPIGGASAFSCLSEFVDQETCYVGTFFYK